MIFLALKFSKKKRGGGGGEVHCQCWFEQGPKTPFSVLQIRRGKGDNLGIIYHFQCSR